MASRDTKLPETLGTGPTGEPPKVAPRPPFTTPPSGMRVRRITTGEDELVVVSLPVERADDEVGLTEAERQVLRYLLEGKTNAEIASARGVAVRTVANQVNAIFRKHEVQSRAELVAKLRPKGNRP